MDFGAAFKHLKAGKAITRTAWLGKGITLCMTPGMTFKVGEAPLGVFPVGSELRIVPHVAMAVGPVLACWQPSQVDILADDWMSVDTGVPEKATEPAETSPVGTNTGHGHVWERPDGVKARCGGPGLCKECSADAAKVGWKKPKTFKRRGLAKTKAA